MKRYKYIHRAALTIQVQEATTVIQEDWEEIVSISIDPTDANYVHIFSRVELTDDEHEGYVRDAEVHFQGFK